MIYKIEENVLKFILIIYTEEILHSDFFYAPFVHMVYYPVFHRVYVVDKMLLNVYKNIVLRAEYQCLRYYFYISFIFNLK